MRHCLHGKRKRGKGEPGRRRGPRGSTCHSCRRGRTAQPHPHTGEGPFLFSVCQARLCEAVRENYGQLRGPRRHAGTTWGCRSRGKGSVWAAGSCSVTEAAEGESMSRNSLGPRRTSHRDRGPLRCTGVNYLRVLPLLHFTGLQKSRPPFVSKNNKGYEKPIFTEHWTLQTTSSDDRIHQN